MSIEEERKQYEEKKISRKLKDAVAPTREIRKKRVDAFKAVAYYMVIGVILLLVTVLVPFLAGGINAQDFNYYIPETTEGWIIFWAIRAGTVVGNVTVYGLFKAQAKTNVKYDPDYKKACELLNKLNGEEGFIPMSPKQKTAKDWITKGLFMTLTTASESIVIGTLIFNFDIVTFISCLSSSITAVLFGIVQMVKDEVYWTEDYLLYAEYVTEQLKKTESTVVEEPVDPEKEEKDNA